MQQNYVQSIHTFGQATTAYNEALSSIQNKSIDNLKDDLLYYQWQDKNGKDQEEADYLFSRLSEGLQKDIKSVESNATGSYIDKQEQILEDEIDSKIEIYDNGIQDAGKTMLLGSNYNSK